MTPSRSMQGTRPFNQEKELVEALKPSILNLLRASLACTPAGSQTRLRRPIILEQVPVGMVIPDLIVIVPGLTRESKLTRRVAVSHFDSSVMVKLREKGSSGSEELSEALFSRTGVVLAALEKLKRLGAVEKADSGEFTLTQAVLPENARVISIEAKLRDWKEALAQAKSYLAFSDYSYIALPGDVIDNSRSIRDSCEKEGIGLLSVRSKYKHVIALAKLNESFSHERVWLLSRTAGLRLPAKT